MTVSANRKVVLQHQPQLAAQVGFADRADILAVDCDLTFLDFIETGQQVDDGRFSRPGRADQGDGLPGFGFEGHILNNRQAGIVAKVDVVKPDVTLDGLQGQRIRRIFNLRPGIDDFKHPFSPSQRGLDCVIHIGQLAERLDEVLPIIDKGGDRADAYQALQRQPTTQSGQDDHKEVAQYIGKRHQQQARRCWHRHRPGIRPGFVCGRLR